MKTPRLPASNDRSAYLAPGCVRRDLGGLGGPEGQHVLGVHTWSHGVAAPELDRQGLHAAKRPDRDWLRARLC